MARGADRKNKVRVHAVRKHVDGGAILRKAIVGVHANAWQEPGGHQIQREERDDQFRYEQYPAQHLHAERRAWRRAFAIQTNTNRNGDIKAKANRPYGKSFWNVA